VEGPVLTATQHAFGQSTASWQDDLVSNYRMMFGLRAAGGMGVLFSRAMGVTRGIGQSLIQHTSALGGMYLMEGGDLSLAKALENLGYFYLNGAWVKQFLGQPFALRELALEQRPSRPAASVPVRPRLAHATGSANEPVAKSLRTEPNQRVFEQNIVRMDNSGNGPTKPPPKPAQRTSTRAATPPAPPLSPSLPPDPGYSSSNPPSTVPRPGAQRRAAELATSRLATPSLLPPVPTASFPAMSHAQLQPLCAFAHNIKTPGHKILALARIASEFSYAGRRTDAHEYFGSAATLIDSLPEPSPLRGRMLSHLALELAKAGDQKGGEVNFQRAMDELERLQNVTDKSPARTIEAYGLAFTIAGDLIGAGREDTAIRLLDRVTPTYRESQLSTHIGEETVMKLVAQGQFEEALILAGRMNKSHYPKMLLKVGKSAVRRYGLLVAVAEKENFREAKERFFREVKKVENLLKGSKGEDDLRIEIFKILALNGEWEEAFQRGLSVEDPAERTHMDILTARLLVQTGEPHHAVAIHNAQHAFLHENAFLKENKDSFPPERRAQLFALLAGNCALWDSVEHSLALYKRVGQDLNPWLNQTPRKSNDGMTEAMAELVFSMQVANQGESIEELLKLLDPSTKSEVIGKVGVKLVEVGRAEPALDWLKHFGKEQSDYSRHLKEISLRELEMGNYQQAIFLAQHISDFGIRFQAFWEIFSWYRGGPVPELQNSTMPPPAKKSGGPPPLPKSKATSPSYDFFPIDLSKYSVLEGRGGMTVPVLDVVPQHRDLFSLSTFGCMIFKNSKARMRNQPLTYCSRLMIFDPTTGIAVDSHWPVYHDDLEAFAADAQRLLGHLRKLGMNLESSQNDLIYGKVAETKVNGEYPGEKIARILTDLGLRLTARPADNDYDFNLATGEIVPASDEKISEK
jgi:hypothetical protein